MNIPALIKAKRITLKESQTVFGNRFNVTHASVSDWENGKSEAGYEVLEFVLERQGVDTNTVIVLKSRAQYRLRFDDNCVVVNDRVWIEEDLLKHIKEMFLPTK